MSTYRLSKDPDNRTSVKSAMNAYINQLPIEETFLVEVKPETRSLRQNRYIWGLVYKTIVEWMREHTGRDISADALHEVLKELFLPYKSEQLKDREVKIYRSTTKLSKAEFCEYVEHIQRWAAGFGCVVEEPDWQWRQSR